MKLELLKGSRSRILAAAILIIVAVFAGRLFYLQIIQHSHYVALAEKEQVKRLTIPAQRGLIYAKNGDDPVRLVMNETVYTAFADPVTVSDKEKVVEVLRQVAGGNVREGFAELLDRTETRYQILATKLSRVQADKIKEADLNGIGFQAVSQRVYPEGSLAAQALGFVDTEGQGRYGIESYMNDALEGVDGRLESVTDVRHVPLTIVNRNIKEPAQDGKNIVMTIDRNIQSYVEQAIRAGAKRTGADEVSALVMDPRNGKILAMANLPTYKPAEYFNVKDVAAFNNATISSPYEPGSDVKTYTMAVGIDKGVVKASDTYNNTDYIRIEDRTITNATKGITGTISFQTAMNWSLNTGFVTVAQRLETERKLHERLAIQCTITFMIVYGWGS
jgi:cell division protein FtsI/penicillin-binding protein 2